MAKGNFDIEQLKEYFEEQKKNLQELIEDNRRLLESPFDLTSVERLKLLSQEVDESFTNLNDTLKKERKELRSLGLGLGNVFKNVDNIIPDLEKIEKKIADSADRIEKKREELQQKIEEIKNTTGSTTLLEAERDLLKDELKDMEEVYNKLTSARDKGKKAATEYYQLANQEQKELNRRIVEGTTGIDDFNEKWEQRSKAFKKGTSEIAEGGKKIYESITKTLEPWRKANHEAMAYAKSMGVSEKTANEYLTRTTAWAADNNIGILFEKTTDELIKMQGQYSEVLGRNVRLTGTQLKDMMSMEKFIGMDTTMEIANSLENLGMGMSDAAGFVHKSMSEANKYGIAASKLTKTISENIKMAQNYTFKNGLEGLKSMAKKAIELKTDMSLINSMLETTSTVEGAITTGAKLQVLGGSYALGSDPLSMLYESLSDVEGMFDRVANMAKGKVYYNEQSGNFEMGAMDRYMMKQAATSMGVDPSKMIDMAYRQASLGRIEGQARMNQNIAGDQDMIDLIKNVATWNNGQAVVEVDGKTKNVSELTLGDKDKLAAMSRTDSENLQDMAISLRSMNDILSGEEKEINNEQAKNTNSIGQNLTKMLKNSTEGLDKFAKVLAWLKSILGLLGVGSGILLATNGTWRTAIGIRNMMGLNSMGNMRGRGGGVRGARGARGAAGAGVSAGIMGNGFTRADFKGGLRQPIITGKNGNTYRDLGGGRIQNVNGGRIITGKVAQSVISTGTKGTGWTNLAKAAGKGMKVGAGVGIAGAALSLGMDAMTGELKKDTGAAVGRAAGGTIGAVLGGAIGGPVGAMIGSFLGDAIVGGIQSWQRKKRGKIREGIANSLAASNPTVAGLFSGDNAMEGNYSKGQLEEIKNALSDNTLDEGELSRSTLRKARANGDIKKMRDAGVNVHVALASGGDIVKNNNFATAIPTGKSKAYLDANKTIVGQSHESGGIHVQDSNINVQGGEKVMSVEAVKKYGVVLNAMNEGANFKIIPIEPIGKLLKVREKHASKVSSMPHNGKFEIAPIDIKISGTIKLDLQGQTVDITNDLLENKTFINNISNYIATNFNKIDNGRYNKTKDKRIGGH